MTLVLRIELDLADTERGGRRRALKDGYRASMSFGRRRRGVEPIVHDAILVLEDVAELQPGDQGTARAWVVMPDELPRHLVPGTVFTLLENDRIVAGARLIGFYDDPTPSPVSDLAAAKTRPFEERLSS